MSNPFTEPGPFISELQRRRRERFTVGVYAVLGITLLFVSGLLIQGCKQQQAQESTISQTSEAAPASQTGVAATTPAAEPPPATNAQEAPFPADSAVASAAPAVQLPSSTPAPAASEKAVEPAARQQPTTSKRVYIVKRGDTLTRIANLHHVSVKALRAANGLKSDRILAGSKLKIPQPRTVAVSATAAAQS